MDSKDPNLIDVEATGAGKQKLGTLETELQNNQDITVICDTDNNKRHASEQKEKEREKQVSERKEQEEEIEDIETEKENVSEKEKYICSKEGSANEPSENKTKVGRIVEKGINTNNNEEEKVDKDEPRNKSKGENAGSSKTATKEDLAITSPLRKPGIKRKLYSMTFEGACSSKFEKKEDPDWEPEKRENICKKAKPLKVEHKTIPVDLQSKETDWYTGKLYKRTTYLKLLLVALPYIKENSSGITKTMYIERLAGLIKNGMNSDELNSLNWEDKRIGGLVNTTRFC